MKQVTIYSDGACEGNPGPGGWAALLIYKSRRRELAGSSPATTNNRMELTAAIEALKALKEPCEVDFYTDSKYVQQGISEWIHKWKAKGWRRGKQPVKNIDLWQALDTESIKHELRWHWVKGHNNQPENERCDQLAVQAIAKLRKELGKEKLAQALREFQDEPAGLF